VAITAAAAEQIGAAGARLDIPLEALLIQVETPPSDHGSLWDKYRLCSADSRS